MSSNHVLHNQSSVIVLDDDHVPIEFLYQSGKGRAGKVVQVLPLVLLKHLTNGE
jgi:hypothetical protein